MADNTVLSTNVGTGDSIRDKDRAGVKTQIVALDLAPAGSETLMNGVMPVNDNSGSLTVDAPVGTPVFVRLSDGSSAIATLPVSIASLPGQVADGAALPAVVMAVAGFDGTNAQALVTDSTGRLILPPTSQAGATAKTSDYDTGAGTDTVPMQGIALPASGGAVQGGTSTNPVRTDPTGTTAQPVTDNGGSLTVDGTVAVSGTVAVTDNAGSLTVDNAGTFAVQIAANSSVNQAQIAGTTTDTNSGTKSAGTQRVVLATDQPQLTNALKVDGSAVTQPVSGTVTANLGTAAVTNAGTFAVQATDTGNVAHDGADSGNPVKVGARARTADVTAVAQDDRVDNIASITGKQVMLPYALPGAATQGNATYTNTTAADVIATPGAGVRLYITEVTVTNAHATVGTKVEIRDGTTVRKIVFAAANGGGASITMPTPLRLTANTALTARCVTTGSDVDVSATGYTAAE